MSGVQRLEDGVTATVWSARSDISRSVCARGRRPAPYAAIVTRKLTKGKILQFELKNDAQRVSLRS
jgi:hypothetical protein